jgi:hypothetical protein
MGPPGGLVLQHHQPLQGLEQHCTGGAQAGAQLGVGDAGAVGQAVAGGHGGAGNTGDAGIPMQKKPAI